MRIRELQNDDPDRENVPVPSTQGNPQLSERRERADAFYEAAQAAIDRVLSSDSEAFLNSMEQTGGQ